MQAKENEAEPAKETFLDFPEKVYWPQLVKVLEEEGYAADARDADIRGSSRNTPSAEPGAWPDNQFPCKE